MPVSRTGKLAARLKVRDQSFSFKQSVSFHKPGLLLSSKCGKIVRNFWNSCGAEDGYKPS